MLKVKTGREWKFTEKQTATKDDGIKLQPNKTMKTLLVKLAPASATALLVALANTGHATFIQTDQAALDKMYVDVANKDVADFQGYVGANNIDGNKVDVDILGIGDTGSGWANVQPVNEGTLYSLLFTPLDGNAFSAFSFHAQLDDPSNDKNINNTGIITLLVQDNQGNTPQTFTFNGIKENALEGPFGIISLDGETIKWVKITNEDFKEVKQISFSFANGVAVPEPTTVIAGALLLVPFGISTLRILRKKSAV